MIGCMKHLEKRGRAKNTFRRKRVFSESQPWYLPEKPEHVDHDGFIYDPDSNECLFHRDKSTDESSGWY